jgi:hypothetical protein
VAKKTEMTEINRGQYGEHWELGEATTDGGRSHACIVVNGSKTAVKCTSAVPFHDSLCGGALADRIVLCINACAGWSDEDLQDVSAGRAKLDIFYGETGYVRGYP